MKQLDTVQNRVLTKKFQNIFKTFTVDLILFLVLSTFLIFNVKKYDKSVKSSTIKDNEN